MSETKFTPGPWKAEFREYGGYDCMSASWSIVSDESEFATLDCRTRDHANDPQQEANANLMAAAPELFDALKELHEISGEANIPMENSKSVRLMGKFLATREKAEAAIKKARGER